ncbi:glycosyltransferase [Roseococcus sp. SYP-B2431]|uniref:glycosyltransferase n=1 Tax=Roseococcus sp. SYP-B2431 TaxID=2496640 RepID=UPI0010406D01|nr:glycosyltransferase [Roseococcus sp. SYP-B2431]TCH99672.1 glycosyltransferase [Roseococcus sp. SYP-B2431]
MTSVHVLLATWNGAAHLGEQLASLAAQEGVEWSLLWRDDGSTDATVAILERFAEAHPGRVARLARPEGRLGAGASFLALLAAAPEGGLYAFMDQDDVWLPGKLARAAAQLGEEPMAVCTRLRLASSALAPLGLSPLPSRPPVFATLLAHNVAAGCTLVLNGAARRLALSAPLPEGGHHDWWCALLVTGCGGRLVFDPEPSLLYRQHGGNLVGGASGLRQRAGRALGRGAAGFLAPLSQHLEALRAAPLTDPARQVLAALEGLRAASPFRRLAALRRAGLAHHARGANWLLRLWVALHPLPGRK